MTSIDLLTAAVAELPQDTRVAFLSPWEACGDRTWSLLFRASLSVAPTADMPADTLWRLIAHEAGGAFTMGVFPAKPGGITATFPHQELNDEGRADERWRSGNPCLERPSAIFRRAGWAAEPEQLHDRLIWRIGRLLNWIDAAASGTLLTDGDHLELPRLYGSNANEVIGFVETETELADLASLPPWGFASIARLPTAKNTSAVAAIADSSRRVLGRFAWGADIAQIRAPLGAVWVRMPSAPILSPWSAPRTWLELSEWAIGVGVDLPSILVEAGARLRRVERPKLPSPALLLLVFPMSEIVGEPAKRAHWLAVTGLALCRREHIRNGFRSIEENRRLFDREFSLKPTPLIWRRTMNWAPDQVRTRGCAEPELTERSVLMIGAGALGGAVAETLARMGVRRIGVMDDDVLHVENLTRHVLSMGDVGDEKAEALARRLNACGPDVSAESFTTSFPPKTWGQKNAIREYEVIIDCTASDRVLEALARFDWGDSEKLFVSLSMTWGARDLFAYAASETTFPMLDAKARFELAAGQDAPQIGAMEGIGCWHPVFPATADDVQLWAALCCKFIRSAAVERGRCAAFFTRDDHGRIERRDVR